MLLIINKTTVFECIYIHCICCKGVSKGHSNLEKEMFSFQISISIQIPISLISINN